MAIIGVQVPHQVARLLNEIEVPGEKTDSANLHITLFHFNKFSIKDVAKAMESTFNISKTAPPFSVEIKCVDYFPVEQGKSYPIVAPIISQKLHNIRRKIQKSLDKNGVEYCKDYKEFKPHITLSFSEERIKKTKIIPIEWSIQELMLWSSQNGDALMSINFPLTIKIENENIVCKTISE